MATIGVQRAQEVDVQLEFEEFFQSQYGALVRAVFLLTGQPEEAEDIAQEALTRVYERWPRVRQMESPVGYLYRVALHLNHRRLRQLLLQARRRLQPHPNSVDPAQIAETRGDVLRVMMSLSPGYREVLVLTEWLGMDASEAGQVLHLRPGSVRSRLHRAREAFRKRYVGVERPMENEDA